jgi:hypothetical protein
LLQLPGVENAEVQFLLQLIKCMIVKLKRQIMKNIIWISAGIIIAMLFGCKDSYNEVSSEYDKSVDFTKYKTFSWLPDVADTINSPYNNDIIRNNIRNYFGLCMSDRGYSFDAENPDLLMQLIITNTKKDRPISDHSASYYYSPYYYGSYYYSPYPYGYYYNDHGLNGNDDYGRNSEYRRTYNQTYVNGSITLTFIDRKTNKVVWRGTAEGDIDNPSDINKDLHPAVHGIIDEYPVKSLVKRSHKI